MRGWGKQAVAARATPGDSADVARVAEVVLVGPHQADLDEIARALAPLRSLIRVFESDLDAENAASVPDPACPRLVVLDLRTATSHRRNLLLRRTLARWPEAAIIALASTHLAGLPVQVIQAASLSALAKIVRLLESQRPGQRPAAPDGNGEASSVDAELTTGPDGLLGDSEPIRALRALVAKAAPTNSSVLITGESGVGKERVARLLHRLSRRRDGPFVPVNCGAFTESLLASELFGHTKGAFTDARTSRSGLLLAASGGTLFLDEIGEMPPPLQVKLLRALQEGTVRPVGADDEVAFDARIIAATNQPIERLLVERRLREDLYFRIAVICIEVPPLRDRGDDILALAQHFVRESAAASQRNIVSLSASAQDLLRSHPWPGNVRQLKNCIEQAVAMGAGPVIDWPDVVIRDTPAAGTRPVASVDSSNSNLVRLAVPRDAHRTDEPPAGSAEGRLAGRTPRVGLPRARSRIDEGLEREIHQALETTGANVRAAARLLGLSRGRMLRLMRKYQISARTPRRRS